jgi:hypothetical protein
MNAAFKIVDFDNPTFDPTEAEKHAFGDHPDPAHRHCSSSRHVDDVRFGLVDRGDFPTVL